ncbi:MAG: hypothetical protein EBR10_09640, partial [Planctomycetes bacterium]|nr:hypothetical protein [Planctomycetota bacterium]
PDSCDIANGTSNDVDADGVPDSCEDCNGDGLPDDWQMSQGGLPDCNGNGVPDTCDITSGQWGDCDGDGRLDICELVYDNAADDNGNCVPDSCEYARGDLGLDGEVDAQDLAYLLSVWETNDPFGDLTGDGLVDGADLAALFGGWGPTGFVTCVTPTWATVVQQYPDPAVVYDSTLRSKIIATGLPWRVRDTATQMEFVLIPPGTFNMGCSASNQDGCYSDENPVHQVTLTNAFYLGRFEVTQAQWQATMGNNPSGWQGDLNRPVEQVSWNTIQGCRRVCVCRRKRSGSTHAEEARQRRSTAGQRTQAARTMTAKLGTSLGTTTTPVQAEPDAAPVPSGRRQPTASACTTCWGMCGSG